MERFTRGLIRTLCIVAFSFLPMAGASSAVAALVVPYVQLTNVNSSTTFGANSFGYVFKTGLSGPYPIDWVELDLYTSSYTGGGPVSLTLSLKDANGLTPYSARAGTTTYASDTFSFNTPTTINTFFKLSLTSAQLPNITAYDLAANTGYALVLSNISVSLAMARKTTGGVANSANSLYTVGEGFTVLNTLRNNNTAQAIQPGDTAYAISFGATSNPVVPEPGTWAAAALLLGAAGYVRWRNRSKTS